MRVQLIALALLAAASGGVTAVFDNTAHSARGLRPLQLVTRAQAPAWMRPLRLGEEGRATGRRPSWDSLSSSADSSDSGQHPPTRRRPAYVRSRPALSAASERRELANWVHAQREGGLSAEEREAFEDGDWNTVSEFANAREERAESAWSHKRPRTHRNLVSGALEVPPHILDTILRLDTATGLPQNWVWAVLDAQKDGTQAGGLNVQQSRLLNALLRDPRCSPKLTAFIYEEFARSDR